MMKNAIGSHRRAPDRSPPAAARRSRLPAVAVFAPVLAATISLAQAYANSADSPAETASACATYGGWIDVKTGRPIERGELFRDLVAKRAVVLLGESHTEVDHHRWQLHTLAELYGRG